MKSSFSARQWNNKKKFQSCETEMIYASNTVDKIKWKTNASTAYEFSTLRRDTDTDKCWQWYLNNNCNKFVYLFIAY